MFGPKQVLIHLICLFLCLFEIKYKFNHIKKKQGNKDIEFTLEKLRPNMPFHAITPSTPLNCITGEGLYS